jgi:hypothetical protein
VLAKFPDAYPSLGGRPFAGLRAGCRFTRPPRSLLPGTLLARSVLACPLLPGTLLPGTLLPRSLLP